MKALVDLDVAIYAAGFAAQHTRYVGFDESGAPIADFRIKQVDSPRAYKVLDEAGAEKFRCDKRPEVFEKLKELGIVETESYVQEEDISGAIHGFKSMVQNIISGARADTATLYLTGKGNFRETVATLAEYKGNRKDSARPVHYEALREYATTHLDAVLIEGMEADDAMAIEQTKDREGTVICTIDKDLMQVPGLKFFWNKRDKKTGDTSDCFIYVDEDTAVRHFFTQLITGDASDNIPGLKGTKEAPGPGARGAKKAFENCSTVAEYYDAALSLYRDKYGDATTYIGWDGRKRTATVDAILQENAALLWMKRDASEGGWSKELMEGIYEQSNATQD